MNGNGKGSNKPHGEVLYSNSNNRGKSGARDSNQNKFKGKGRAFSLWWTGEAPSGPLDMRHSWS